MSGFRRQERDHSSENRNRDFRFWLVLFSITGLAGLLIYVGGQAIPAFAAPPQALTSSTPPQFMGMNMSSQTTKHGGSPWPSFQFGSFPTWGMGTTWPTLNPSDGVYDFSNLDYWINTAAAHGVTDIIYSFGKTPTWASSKPNDQFCVNPASPPGSCDPPNDVNPDGTGTDQHVIDFFTALATHVGTQIQYYEMWNEANDRKQWTGTDAQLVRMSMDARNTVKAINPAALITTPSPAGGVNNEGEAWMDPYFAAGGGQYADVMTFHGYLTMLSYTPPEAEVPLIVAYKKMLSKYGYPTMPMWDTQAGWNLDTNLPDPDMQAAYLSRIYLLSKANGVARFYWYSYSNGKFGTIDTNGVLNPAGIAFEQIYTWLVGSIESAPCTAVGTVYTCGFKMQNGLQEQPVWDTAQSCNAGVCTTSTFTPSTLYVKYMDLSGNITQISPPGSPIQIGAKPICLMSK